MNATTISDCNVKKREKIYNKTSHKYIKTKICFNKTTPTIDGIDL